MISRRLLLLFNNSKTCVCKRNFSFTATNNFHLLLLSTKNTGQINILGSNNIISSSNSIPNSNNVSSSSSSSCAYKLESDPSNIENEHSTLVEVPDDNGIHLHLSELLEISTYSARRIVTNFREFCETTEDEISDRIDYLESKNVNKQRIRKMPWLLLLDSKDIEEWTEKIGEMLKLDFICSVSFLKVPRTDWLNQVATLWNSEQAVEEEFKSGQYKNRLEYIADKLQCEKSKVADMMLFEQSLQEQPFHRLKYVLDFLLDNGMKTTEIISEPMVFKLNIPLIKRRINLARLNQVDNITAWMIRTTDKSFYMYIEDTKKQQKLVSKYPDLSKFLEESLNCDKEEIKKIIYNEPSLRNTKTISKIKSMFKNLVDKGFKITDIKRVPKLLCQNEETLQCRYEELVKMASVQPKDIGNFSYSFTKNDNEWSNFILRYTAKINNNNKNATTDKTETEV